MIKCFTNIIALNYSRPSQYRRSRTPESGGIESGLTKNGGIRKAAVNGVKTKKEHIWYLKLGGGILGRSVTEGQYEGDDCNNCNCRNYSTRKYLNVWYLSVQSRRTIIKTTN